MARFLPLLLSLLAVRPVPAAEPVPVIDRSSRTALAITAYTQDLGLVKDTRTLELPAGETTIRFEDVAARIDPRTVAIRAVGDPDAVTVVEQNYVFDLISPAKLMEKYVGHEVELIETDQQLQTQTTKATLLSTNDGYVYRIGDRIAVGFPGRVVLPELPEELYARPTLLWRLASASAGKHPVEVSYLTGGLGWEADYVLVVSADDAKGALTGWVTLTNESGARYDDATLKLVAGTINRAAPPMEKFRAMAQDRAMAAPAFAEEAFFDYHLYTLDRKVTIAENEKKQLRLLGGAGIALAQALPARRTADVVALAPRRPRAEAAGGRRRRVQERHRQPPRHAAARGNRPPLQAGRVGRGAAGGRGSHRAHAEGRDGDTQGRRRLRHRRLADADGLQDARHQAVRPGGRVRGDHPQPQDRSGDGHAARAGGRRVEGDRVEPPAGEGRRRDARLRRAPCRPTARRSCAIACRWRADPRRGSSSAPRDCSPAVAPTARPPAARRGPTSSSSPSTRCAAITRARTAARSGRRRSIASPPRASSSSAAGRRRTSPCRRTSRC